MFLEIMAAATAISSVFGAISGGNAQRRAANASIEEGDRLAEDALTRGRETARRYGIDLAQLMGRQRAVMAAGGVDLSQGSAAAYTAETTRIGQQELALIRENARREAFGLRRAGKNQALGLRAGASASYGQAFESVLNFGANAWTQYRQGRGGPLSPMSAPAARSSSVASNPFRPVTSYP